jgi:glucose/arabinose dehydrogenase
MRRRTRRSLLVLAAKVAGAVTLVVVLVVVRPFVGPDKPYSGSTLAPYASGLVAPTYVAAAPGEPRRLYVVEQAGRIRYLVGGRIAGTFLDIRSRVANGGERGLLSVAFSPDYARDHRFYVDYTDRNGDTRVVEFRSRGGRALLGSARQLLFVKQPYPNHNGGQLQFGPDGLLYVGMGDGGAGGDPQNRAQNLHERLGKLLRIDPRARSARWEAIGYGLRNPWRFSFDRATGDLYIGDVGQSNWEEVDFRPRSKLDVLANYGWRVFEGRARFAPGAPTAAGELVPPISVYSHKQGCSITGGYVYRGHGVPAAVGRYYFGDFCSGRVYSLRVERGRATALRQESARIAELSSFGEDGNGELYATSLNGRIYRLLPASSG